MNVTHILERMGLMVRVRKRIFLELEIEEKTYYIEKNNQIRFLRLRKDNFEELDYRGRWLTKEQALKRLDKGFVLFAGYDNEKMICHEWIELHQIGFSSFELSPVIPDNTAYVCHLYTDPQYRGRGLALQITSIVLQYLKDHDYRKVFIIVAPENISSLKLHEKFRYRAYQTVFYCRCSFRNVLSLRYYFVKDCDTNRRKIFWRIGKAEQELWRTFSKI